MEFDILVLLLGIGEFLLRVLSHSVGQLALHHNLILFWVGCDTLSKLEQSGASLERNLEQNQSLVLLEVRKCEFERSKDVFAGAGIADQVGRGALFRLLDLGCC